MKITSAEEMIEYGERVAAEIKPPAVIELIGDVGAGKTTFTQGLASGLGVETPITSPSFTISKRYPIAGGELVHYDFYRIPDAGIMEDELAEVMMHDGNVVVLEWAGGVSKILPENSLKIEFKLLPDGTREVERQKK